MGMGDGNRVIDAKRLRGEAKEVEALKAEAAKNPEATRARAEAVVADLSAKIENGKPPPIIQAPAAEAPQTAQMNQPVAMPDMTKQETTQKLMTMKLADGGMVGQDWMRTDSFHKKRG
jgi:hypothetical protein